MVLDRVPGETGNPEYEKLLREQSIGEIRGLQALQRAIDIELEDLRERTKQQN